MRVSRRPFLSLFLCLALAVNLLVPFASASPLFVEICSGHRTILVPAQDAPDPGACETCMQCCVGLAPPDFWHGPAPEAHALPAVTVPAALCQPTQSFHRKARAPPFHQA